MQKLIRLLIKLVRYLSILVPVVIAACGIALIFTPPYYIMSYMWPFIDPEINAIFANGIAYRLLGLMSYTVCFFLLFVLWINLLYVIVGKCKGALSDYCSSENTEIVLSLKSKAVSSLIELLIDWFDYFLGFAELVRSFVELLMLCLACAFCCILRIFIKTLLAKPAFACMRYLAGCGFDLIQFDVAKIYETGQGVDKDLDEAFKWYRLAAEQGLDCRFCK